MPARDQSLGGIEPAVSLAAARVLALSNNVSIRGITGMLMAMLGHIPVVAETYAWEGYRFEVVDRDGARIDKVLVSDLSETAAL